MRSVAWWLGALILAAGCAGAEPSSSGPTRVPDSTVISKPDAEFFVEELEGNKVWKGGQTIDLKAKAGRPLTIKVRNPLGADHGFSIDTMKVREVIAQFEERIITVPLDNIDRDVLDHRVYCQLHPKHVAATLRVIGR